MKAEQVIGVIGMATMTIRPGDTSVAQGVNVFLNLRLKSIKLPD